jgi:hypothetical protein
MFGRGGGRHCRQGGGGGRSSSLPGGGCHWVRKWGSGGVMG